MTKSALSCPVTPDPAPLHGEILPPAHLSTVTVAEMSPAEFLAAHGIRAPKPKSYRSFDAAIRAIVAEVAGAKP
jgi:hypothetical protein